MSITLSQRHQVYEGAVLSLPAKFLPLACEVEHLWQECFLHPLAAFVPDHTTWEKVFTIRQKLQHERYKALAQHLLGIKNAKVSGLSFRLLHPHLPERLHNTALCLHRDTWYNLPQHSINVWVGMTGCTNENTFKIFPSFFDQALEVFNYKDTFSEKSAVFPQAHPDTVTDHPFVAVETGKGDAVVFSSHHLHQSCTGGSGLRASLDFRFTVLGEEALGPQYVDRLRRAP